MSATIGELCMGYGGLGMGLSLALGGDTRVAWAVEYDKHPSAIIAHRYPGVPNYGDVKTTDWTQVEPVDWLTAGYPCQPFSVGGVRKGEDDERHLWPYIADAVRLVRPRRVLLENVAGHLSLGFGPVLGDLASLGYDARWVRVRAADAGAPHSRARVFIVAADARRERHGRGEDGRRLGRLDRSDAGEARERERPREESCDRGTAAASDSAGGRSVRREDTRAGRDDASSGRGRVQPERVRRERPAAPVADAGSARLGEHPAGSLAEEAGTLAGHIASGDRGSRPVVEWGPYGPAIARWAAVTGRPAPRPTEPGRSGERLSPRFVEWMMGLPDGWVTDVPGLPRNAQLKALGNGVVPQQAALACRLLRVTAEAVAA